MLSHLLLCPPRLLHHQCQCQPSGKVQEHFHVIVKIVLMQQIPRRGLRDPHGHTGLTLQIAAWGCTSACARHLPKSELLLMSRHLQNQAWPQPLLLTQDTGFQPDGLLSVSQECPSTASPSLPLHREALITISGQGNTTYSPRPVSTTASSRKPFQGFKQKWSCCPLNFLTLLWEHLL